MARWRGLLLATVVAGGCSVGDGSGSTGFTGGGTVPTGGSGLDTSGGDGVDGGDGPGSSSGADGGPDTGMDTGNASTSSTGGVDDTGSGPTSGAGTTSGGDTTTGPAVCGDGVAQGSEGCDTTDFAGASCADFGFGDGQLTCTVDCTVQTADCFTCGDGTLQGPEVCDGTNFGIETCVTQGFGPGNLGCSGDCMTIDTGACPPPAVCGNDMIEGTEQCDGTDLGGQTCVSRGFDSGTLACSQSCFFNTSGCMNTPTCGTSGQPCNVLPCCSGICFNGNCL